MSHKQIFITREGLNKLKAELEYLHNIRRPQIAQQIQRAKEIGGTANNAEYDDAKNEQAFIEGRILKLETEIENAVIIDEQVSPHDSVVIGSRVTVVIQDGKEEHYTIVGSAEANPAGGKISNESPVGQALLGKRIGDEIQVSVPAGILKLKVINIE